MRKIEDKNFSMYDFWIRRVKRLLPLLLVVVIAVLVAAPFLIFKPEVKNISKDIFPSVFSWFNFHALLNFGNYWGAKAESSFFLHTWSLSVEEQFYLLYPFFLFVAFKYFKNLIKPLFVITALSFLFFVFFINQSKSITFYMLPTRMWELSVGGLVAVVSQAKSFNIKFHNQILPIIGVCLILISYFFAQTSISYIVMLPVLGSALVIMYCNPTDYVGRILSSSLFVKLGRLSYSIYLWHWPIIVLFKNREYQLRNYNSHLINISIVMVTMVLSYVTYHFVESKTRNYRYTPQMVLFGIVFISLVTFYYQSNYFNIYYDSKYNKADYFLRYYDISPNYGKIQKEASLSHGIQLDNQTKKTENAYKEEGLITRINNKDPEIVLMGDSHGAVWAKLLDDICDELNIGRSFYTSNGNKPFFDMKNVSDQYETKYYSRDERVEYAKSLLSNLEKWNFKIVM